MNEPNDKLQGGNIAIPKTKIGSFLENVWYHYKWHIIIITFFVAVLGICFVQCATTERPDILMTYAGGYSMSGEEKSSVDKLFTDLASKDQETPTSVFINPYSIYTEEELRAMYYGDGTDQAQNSAAVMAYNSAKQSNLNDLTNLSTFLMTGESAILLVSEWVYQTKLESNPERMVALNTIWQTEVENAYDAYAIKFSQTDLYQKYEVLQFLPEDTLLVLLQPTFAGEISHEEVYATHKQLFCKIVEFKSE